MTDRDGKYVTLDTIESDMVKKRALRCNPEKISKLIKENLSAGKTAVKVCLAWSQDRVRGEYNWTFDSGGLCPDIIWKYDSCEFRSALICLVGEYLNDSSIIIDIKSEEDGSSFGGGESSSYYYVTAHVDE